MGDTPGSLTGATVGRFRVGPLLGRGGMGEVYRADDTELGRAVALKVLPASVVGDADRLSRFIQEARTASALNHPHLVAIYDIGRAAADGAAPPVHYIAMELVDGETLRHTLDARKPDLKKIVDYFAQIADALAAAHAAGIVHRDMKPDNVMVATAGYVKVLDFGLAKLRADGALVGRPTEATITAGTAPGVVMGTVGYMSPEQAQGETVDHRSDVFSFGCMLYEAVTGSRPFSGTSAVDTLHKIIHEQPAPVSALAPSFPAEIQRIVRKCLAKSRDERYQSMKEVAIDLRELRRQVDSQATVATPIPAARPARSARWIIAAVAALMIVAAAAAWIWGSRGGGDAPSKPLDIQRITGSGNVTDATISPDGKYIVYVESYGGMQSLLVRQMSGTRPLELVPRADVGFWGTRFTPDSSAVYYVVRSKDHPTGTLFRVPLLGGTPQRILSGIDSTITLSPDGSRLAYLRADFPEAGSSAVMVANADGSDARPLVGRKAPEIFAPGFFVAPSWSPDGTRIAAAIRNSSTRDAGLAVISVADGAITELPGRYADATFTCWLLDGSGILFVARAIGSSGPGGGGQLWLQPFPSGDVRRVTNDLVDYRSISLTADGRSLVTVGFDATASVYLAQVRSGPAPRPSLHDLRRIPSERYDGLGGISWSHDARRIFFGTQIQASRQIFVMEADGSGRREFVAESPSIWPAPSPDGKMVVFFGTRGKERGIWRVDADGTGRRLIAAVPDASHLTFSPDSRMIYFTSLLQGSPSTWSVPADGGTPALVAPRLERASVSPDGRYLGGAYRASPSAPFSLAVLPVGGGDPVHDFPGLSPASGSGATHWTADGAGLLYTSAERTNIWLQRLSGGAPEKITDFSDMTVFRFHPSPDGRAMVLARGTQTRDAFLMTNFR